MDLEEMLGGILKDEESMKKIGALAAQLSLPEAKTETGGAEDLSEVKKIMSLVSRFKNQKEDNRTRLLLALKPMLSDEKAKRIDGAVKLLKIIDLLPLIKETDLFSNLF